MHPSGTTVFALCATLAVLAAISIVSLERISGRRDPDIWRLFGAQLALTTCVLLPAWFGGAYFMAFLAAVVVTGSFELYAVLLRGRRGMRPPLELACALLVLGLGAWSLQRVAALGVAHFIFFYVVVELNDSFAAIVGRYAGRTPLAPRLSPRKTWEGLVAGLFAAGSVGYALAFLEPGLSAAGCVLLGLSLGVCGVAADLSASALKRHAGVKDFSNLIPGHGGALDAYDSLLLVAPIFGWLLRWLR